MSTRRPIPPGLILLSQPVLHPISLAEMAKALPEEWQGLPQTTIELSPPEFTQQAMPIHDWPAAARALEEQYHAQVEPLRQKHPDYLVVYFGTAPVPLALRLGTLVGTLHPVAAMLHDHERRVWEWRAPAGQDERPPAELAPLALPRERDRTPGEAVIRVSTSHLVDPHLTRQHVPSPLVELDVALVHPAENAFTTGDELDRVAEAFKQALDNVSDRFPGMYLVHVFASVQPGVAFLLGTRLSSTMHLEVQTYQYVRTADIPHVPVLRIGGPTPPPPLPLTEEDIVRAARDRSALGQDLAKMKAWAEQFGSRPETNWTAVLSDHTLGALGAVFAGAWRHLPAVWKTPILRSTVDEATRIVDDSFVLDPRTQTWQLDDRWLARLAARLADATARRRSLRMLLWHEAVHRGPQGLTSATSAGIGRFPKVLEEIDYQADVWTMVHDYLYTRLDEPKAAQDPVQFFRKAIRVATATMWAFDDGAGPLREFQVRRLNRYLTWYWQYLMLEHNHSPALELQGVLELLATRPLIELAGPELHTHGERIWFSLDPRRMRNPELAVYAGGRLYRHGPRIDLSIERLIEGVRQRNEDQIIDVLRSVVDHTAR